MINRFAMMALTISLSGAFVFAQEPGKDRPGDKGEKLEKKLEQLEKQKGPDAKPAEPEREDPKEIVKRITRNMMKSEQSLGKFDVSDETRKLQRDIISDLDKLL